VKKLREIRKKKPSKMKPSSQQKKRGPDLYASLPLWKKRKRQIFAEKRKSPSKAGLAPNGAVGKKGGNPLSPKPKKNPWGKGYPERGCKWNWEKGKGEKKAPLLPLGGLSLDGKNGTEKGGSEV